MNDKIGKLVARVGALLRMSEMEREMARLYQESEARAAQIAAVNRITSAISSSLDIRDVYRTFFAELKAIVGFDRASLALLDASGENLTVQVLSGEAGDGLTVGAYLPLADSAQGYTVVEGEALLRRDLREEQSFALDGKALEAGLLSDISVPLVFKTRVLGVFTLGNRKLNAYSDHDLEILRQVAGQLAAAIENARLYSEAKRADELAALNRIATAMASTLDLDQVLVLAMQGINQTLQVEAGSLLLLDEAEGELVPRITLWGAKPARGEMTLSLGQGVAGWVVQEGKPLLLLDARQEDQLSSTTAQLLGVEARSVLCVPLVLREKTIGAIEVINKWGGRFTEDDLTLLNSIAASVAIAIENARLYAEVKDFADELARSQAQLIQSEKLAATGKLAASIAHELNNPLQAVQSCVYLVADQTAPNDPNRQYLDIAREELDRVARIVERMVDFYRPADEGRIPTDVNALLENVVALVRKRLQQGDIEVDLKLTPNLPLIMATGDHLKQVFLNMIINALEAMPQGGRLEMVTRYISGRNARTKASADDGFVEIEFTDTGVGIPEEHINNIFDPFYTTKSKGMGLGLSVSYGIVERHGGQIQVKSKVGEGTTFTVRLPVEGGR